MPDAHKNFAYSTVATAPSPATTGTSLVIAAGDGAKFPAPPFNLTVWPTAANPLTTNAEIIRCTAIVTDTLTIARAQEGSTARSIVTGDQIAATITAKTLTDLETELISFEGDWAAPTTYTDGDVIVYNGVAYLCVKGPTTVTPDPTLWGASALAKVAYGTNLPGSPGDGQEAILVDDITNPTYQWRFRYNAGSISAYKWEFIGGSVASLAVEANTGINITTLYPTFTDLGNVPGFVAPRAGEYNVLFSANCTNNAAGGSAMIAIKVGSAAVVELSVTYIYLNANWYAALAKNVRLTGIAAGDAIRIVYTAYQAGTAGFDRRVMHVQPIRVS
jgi:hypothetical protein